MLPRETFDEKFGDLQDPEKSTMSFWSFRSKPSARSGVGSSAVQSMISHAPSMTSRAPTCPSKLLNLVKQFLHEVFVEGVRGLPNVTKPICILMTVVITAYLLVLDHHGTTARPAYLKKHNEMCLGGMGVESAVNLFSWWKAKIPTEEVNAYGRITNKALLKDVVREMREEALSTPGISTLPDVDLSRIDDIIQARHVFWMQIDFYPSANRTTASKKSDMYGQALSRQYDKNFHPSNVIVSSFGASNAVDASRSLLIYECYVYYDVIFKMLSSFSCWSYHTYLWIVVTVVSMTSEGTSKNKDIFSGGKNAHTISHQNIVGQFQYFLSMTQTSCLIFFCLTSTVVSFGIWRWVGDEELFVCRAGFSMGLFIWLLWLGMVFIVFYRTGEHLIPNIFCVSNPFVKRKKISLQIISDTTKSCHSKQDVGNEHGGDANSRSRNISANNDEHKCGSGQPPEECHDAIKPVGDCDHDIKRIGDCDADIRISLNYLWFRRFNGFFFWLAFVYQFGFLYSSAVFIDPTDFPDELYYGPGLIITSSVLLGGPIYVGWKQFEYVYKDDNVGRSKSHIPSGKNFVTSPSTISSLQSKKSFRDSPSKQADLETALKTATGTECEIKENKNVAQEGVGTTLLETLVGESAGNKQSTTTMMPANIVIDSPDGDGGNPSDKTSVQKSNSYKSRPQELQKGDFIVALGFFFLVTFQNMIGFLLRGFALSSVMIIIFLKIYQCLCVGAAHVCARKGFPEYDTSISRMAALAGVVQINGDLINAMIFIFTPAFSAEFCFNIVVMVSVDIFRDSYLHFYLLLLQKVVFGEKKEEVQDEDSEDEDSQSKDRLQDKIQDEGGQLHNEKQEGIPRIVVEGDEKVRSHRESRCTEELSQGDNPTQMDRGVEHKHLEGEHNKVDVLEDANISAAEGQQNARFIEGQHKASLPHHDDEAFSHKLSSSREETISIRNSSNDFQLPGVPDCEGTHSHAPDRDEFASRTARKTSAFIRASEGDVGRNSTSSTGSSPSFGNTLSENSAKRLATEKHAHAKKQLERAQILLWNCQSHGLSRIVAIVVTIFLLADVLLIETGIVTGENSIFFKQMRSLPKNSLFYPAESAYYSDKTHPDAGVYRTSLDYWSTIRATHDDPGTLALPLPTSWLNSLLFLPQHPDHRDYLLNARHVDGQQDRWERWKRMLGWSLLLIGEFVSCAVSKVLILRYLVSDPDKEQEKAEQLVMGIKSKLSRGARLLTPSEIGNSARLFSPITSGMGLSNRDFFNPTRSTSAEGRDGVKAVHLSNRDATRSTAERTAKRKDARRSSFSSRLFSLKSIFGKRDSKTSNKSSDIQDIVPNDKSDLRAQQTKSPPGDPTHSTNSDLLIIVRNSTSSNVIDVVSPKNATDSLKITMNSPKNVATNSLKNATSSPKNSSLANLRTMTARHSTNSQRNPSKDSTLSNRHVDLHLSECPHLSERPAENHMTHHNKSRAAFGARKSSERSCEYLLERFKQNFTVDTTEEEFLELLLAPKPVKSSGPISGDEDFGSQRSLRLPFEEQKSVGKQESDTFGKQVSKNMSERSKVELDAGVIKFLFHFSDTVHWDRWQNFFLCSYVFFPMLAVIEARYIVYSLPEQTDDYQSEMIMAACIIGLLSTVIIISFSYDVKQYFGGFR